MVQSKLKEKPAKKAFHRTQRITKKSDFSKLRSGASKWVARHWILFYLKNPDSPARLAVTISARYGNAVHRNILRRWLRETFRKNQEQLAGWDLHFVAKQKPAALDKKRYKDELNEDFQRLLHRFS